MPSPPRPPRPTLAIVLACGLIATALVPPVTTARDSKFGLAGFERASHESRHVASAHEAGAGIVAGYRLVDEWRDAAWSPRAFHFADASDVASNEHWWMVLDRAQNALHLAEVDGDARQILWRSDAEDGDDPWRWIRLDTGLDGRVHLLARGLFEGEAPGGSQVRYRIDVIEDPAAADWAEAMRSYDLGTVSPERYVDLAVGPDGRVFVVRTDGNVASRGDVQYHIDILDPSQTPASVETWVPERLYIPLQIEVDDEGAIYLIDQFPHSNQSQPPGTVDGIHVYEADRSQRETIQFSGAMDLAVGSAGQIYVTRNREIYRLDQDGPFHVGPTIQKNPYALTPLGVPEMFSLDVADEDRLLASMTHCSVQGLLVFDRARIDAGRPDALLRREGALDAPRLAGPVHPFRIDADRSIRLLQARYETSLWQDAPDQWQPDEGPGAIVPSGGTSQLHSEAPQTLQLWQEGRLLDQSGACGVWNAPFGLRDLAVDGDDVWTMDFQAIKRRGLDPLAAPPGLEPEPEPTFGFEFVGDLLATPQLRAIAADAGKAAVLDAGSQRVAIVGRDMQARESWSYVARQDDGWAPDDIAMRDGRVALAARGERRVTVFDQQGAALAQWWEARPIRAIAMAPGGAVIALLEGGWLARRAQDGHLEALWRLPNRPASPRDVAVDAAGRVYVPWLEVEPNPAGIVDPTQAIGLGDSGIWVFEPSLAFEAAGPDQTIELEGPDSGQGSEDCQVATGSWAEPWQVARGSAVRIERRLDADCAPADRALDLVLIVDSSASMNNDNALDRAQQALSGLLGRLDPASPTRVAVIGYDAEGGASLLAPFGGSLDDARRELAELVAAGPTGVDRSLELARGLLAEAGATGGQGAVLWATDGAAPSPGDDPSAGLQGLAQDGIPVFIQLHPFRTIRDAQIQSLVGWVGAERVLDHHGPEGLDEQVDRLYRRAGEPSPPALGRVEIIDRLAKGMRYVEASAEPEAEWDPTARSLTWRLESPSDGRFALAYRVEPEGIGSWLPVSESTVARFEWAGETRELGFASPAIRVTAPGSALLPSLLQFLPGAP